MQHLTATLQRRNECNSGKGAAEGPGAHAIVCVHVALGQEWSWHYIIAWMDDMMMELNVPQCGCRNYATLVPRENWWYRYDICTHLRVFL